MAKLKYINKNGRSRIVMKLTGDEKLISSEASYLSNNRLDGFLHVDVDNSSKITFSGVNGIPLSQFLKQRQLIKDQFFMIAAQLIEIYKTALHFGMNMQKFILDPDYIMICENTGEIGVIYQPVSLPKITGHGFKNFFFRLVTDSRFAASRDFASVSGFISCIEKKSELSVPDAEEYIMEASPVTYSFVKRSGGTATLKTPAAASAPKKEEAPKTEPPKNAAILQDMATTYADADDFEEENEAAASENKANLEVLEIPADYEEPKNDANDLENIKITSIEDVNPKSSEEPEEEAPAEALAEENVPEAEEEEEIVPEAVEEAPVTEEESPAEAPAEETVPEAEEVEEIVPEAVEEAPVTEEEAPAEDAVEENIPEAEEEEEIVPEAVEEAPVTEEETPVEDTAEEVPEETEKEETAEAKETAPAAAEKIPSMLSDDNATVLLSSDEPAPVIMHGASLTSRKTGERTILVKDTTIVGKERARVDFCIKGNPTVSRVHAEIRRNSDGYFAVDRNSTNRTFVNGSPIPVKTEIKLHSGDIIRFSNEEFEFREN